MNIPNLSQNQLRSIIQWENLQDNELFFQWIYNGDEIKNASKLIVNPGQGCLVLYEGKVQAVIQEPGMYNLKTDNIPFITSLQKVLQLIEGSEHVVGIYFFRLGSILNSKYGTPAPIVYQDPVYNFPVGLRAFGNYSFRIIDAEAFFKNIVIGADAYMVEKIQTAINARISQPFADYLANSKYSFAEIDAHRETIAKELLERVKIIFQELGFEINDLRIEGTSFDEETQQRIAKISDVAADVHAAKVAGLEYVELQQVQALRDAAKNEGGVAGVGAGLGAGMALGNMMTDVMKNNAGSTGDDTVVKLEKLKGMLDKGLITEEEYTTKKQDILKNL